MLKSPLCQGKNLKRFLAILLTMLLFSLLSYSIVAFAQEDYYHEDFEWSYKGNDWTASLDIPKSLYDSYRSVPVSTRTRNGLAGYGFLTTTNDPYLQMVAEKLEEATQTKNYESFDKVSFVLAFVQSLPYTSDSVTSGYDEYPRFPLETLVDNGGDCEDTSILFATLTLIMGFGTVYINPPEHYAVGVLGEATLPGYYYTLNDEHYYYCETTGNGFEIGEIPSEFEKSDAYIYEIYEYQQYDPESASNTFSGFYDLGLFASVVACVAIALVVLVIVRLSASNKQRNQMQINQSFQELGVSSELAKHGSEVNKFCRYCGASNEVDAAFCEKCGRKIE